MHLRFEPVAEVGTGSEFDAGVGEIGISDRIAVQSLFLSVL